MRSDGGCTDLVMDHVLMVGGGSGDCLSCSGFGLISPLSLSSFHSQIWVGVLLVLFGFSLKFGFVVVLVLFDFSSFGLWL